MGYQFNPFTGNLDVVGSGGGGNPFNQSLNTTDDVAFNSITSSSYLLSNAGSQYALPYLVEDTLVGSRNYVVSPNGYETAVAYADSSNAAQSATSSSYSSCLLGGGDFWSMSIPYNESFPSLTVSNIYGDAYSYTLPSASGTISLFSGDYADLTGKPNQSLNTTDSVSFANVVGENFSTSGNVSGEIGAFASYVDCGSLRIGGTTVDFTTFATLTDTQTLFNKTLVAPRISNGSTSAILSADAANILSVANSNVSGCGLRIFNTRTDASNFERGVFDWTVLANTLTIGTMKGGTGASRDVRIRSTNNVDIFALDTTQAATFRSGVTIIYTPLQFVPTTKAGAATTADLSSGRAGLFKNSTDGSVRLWMNDAGVMKSVALT